MRHQFWGAGEPECPPELKTPNGELHTTRCKVCGDGWRKTGNLCLTTAAADVLAERERQRQKWGDQHDDEHTNDALAYGAVDYLLPGQAVMPSSWAYKSKVKDRDPRRDQLLKGAALALAALEQHDRTYGVKGGHGQS